MILVLVLSTKKFHALLKCILVLVLVNWSVTSVIEIFHDSNYQ